MFKSKVYLAVLSGFALGANSVAYAQSAEQESETPTENREQQIEVITVKAQNRLQRAIDVPIAMNVISAGALKDAGVSDLNSLTRLAPDIQIANDTIFNRIAIRGIGTNSNDEGQDQSLTINIDGDYINRPISLNASLFDIEQVEVLRGPQGTLYGRNATGGALNIRARRPGQEFGGNASVTSGNYGQLNLDTAIDIPLSDTTAIRVAGISLDNDGYNYHPNMDDSTNDQGVKSFRLSGVSRPTDALNLYVAAEKVDVSQTAPTTPGVNLNAPGLRADENGPGCTGAGWVEVAPNVPGTQCIPANTNFRDLIDPDRFDAPNTKSGLGFFDSDQTSLRSEINYAIAEYELTYKVGYRKSESGGDLPLMPRYIYFNTKVDSETLSQELRLNGQTGENITWQGGVFVFSEDQDLARGLYSEPAGPTGRFINYFYRKVNADSKALFAQADIGLNDTTTFIVGARYTDDKKSGEFINMPGLAGTTPPAADPARTIRPEAKADKFTWTAGINYKPNVDTLYYAKASTGFKAGGFDSVGDYAPETVMAYELGNKNLFGNGNYSLNISAFYYDYEDLQVSALLDSSIGAQTFNAGKAEIYGLETQFVAYVTQGGRLTFNVNYLSSEYKDLPAAYPVQCVGGCSLNSVGNLTGDPTNVIQPNLAGNTAPQAPKWVVSLGYDHDWDLASGGYVTASAQSKFKDDYYTNIFNWADDLQKSFIQTDLSLKYTNSTGMYSIQAYLRNMENIRPQTYTQFTSAGPDDIFNWNFAAPRTYGVTLTYSF
jgi:iron complex outermembrane receptor protein